MKSIFKTLVYVCLFLSLSGLAETITLPSVTNSEGLNGSYWKTSIGVFNPSEEHQFITAVPVGLAIENPSTLLLPPGRFFYSDDLVSAMSLPSGTYMIVLSSDKDIVSTARTYSSNPSNPAEGSYGTLLVPVQDMQEPTHVTFTRLDGARKALFLYGAVNATCAVYDPLNPPASYTGHMGEITRISLPDITLGCTISPVGFPGGDMQPYEYLRFAWGSEADNVTNCPTLIPAN